MKTITRFEVTLRDLLMREFQVTIDAEDEIQAQELVKQHHPSCTVLQIQRVTDDPELE